ncbi:MAG: type II secretion system F family protein [Candidatus Methanomethylophilaceae archaeon]
MELHRESKNPSVLQLSLLKQKRKLNTSLLLLIVCLSLAMVIMAIAALAALGSFNADPLQWYDLLAIALAVATGPYGFYNSIQIKKKKDIEKRLPDFLRDVAEAGRFGMTLADAIHIASHGKYGKLTPEIKRMAAQIEWGVSVTDALQLFVDRVETPLVQRMIAIIIKANDAGGNVADVLSMVAHDAREVQLSEDERKMEMATYMIVIYIAYFVFIATIFIMNSVFLPSMMNTDIEGAGISMINVAVIAQIQVIFVLSVIVHAVGDGLMAGVLADGSLSNGMRHSFIMLLSGVLALRILGGA